MVVQWVGTLLILLLAVAIRRHLPRRPWSDAWVGWWAALACAVACIVLQYSRFRGLADDATATGRPHLLVALHVVYFVLKLEAFALLAAGTLGFASVVPTARALRWGAPAALGAGLALGLAAPTFAIAMTGQAFLAVPLYAALAIVMLRLPAGRRTLGSRLVAAAFALHALLWAGYGILFVGAQEPAWLAVSWGSAVLTVSPLLDLGVLVLLAVGFLLALVEDARRGAEEERAQLQRELAQAQKMEALGRLVSGVAHELNNPLSAILGFAQQLAEEGRADGVGAARTIVEQAERARRIVRDLLAAVRGREEPRAPFSPAEAVARVARGSGGHPVPPARLEVTLPPELPEVVGDRAGIEQVIANLVTNAAYSAGPQGWVRVGAEAVDGRVRVWVEDSGPGVATEHEGRIFEPFFTTKQPGEGTGLGLAVSRGIVERHGGRLRFENHPAPGVGVRFVIELPAGGVLRVTPTEGIPSTRRPAAPGAAAGRLLLIDDEAAVRAALRRYLERRGWTVVEAADGVEGLIALTGGGEPFDVVVSDLRMPRFSGIDLHRWMAASRPGLTRRLLFITGDTASPEVQAFLDDLALPVLQKPFDLAALDEAARRLAGTSR